MTGSRLIYKPKPARHGGVPSKHYERDHDRRYRSNHDGNAWHAHHSQGDIGHGDMRPRMKESATSGLMPKWRPETEVYAYTVLPLCIPTGDEILHDLIPHPPDGALILINYLFTRLRRPSSRRRGLVAESFHFALLDKHRRKIISAICDFVRSSDAATRERAASNSSDTLTARLAVRAPGDAVDRGGGLGAFLGFFIKCLNKT